MFRSRILRKNAVAGQIVDRANDGRAVVDTACRQVKERTVFVLVDSQDVVFVENVQNVEIKCDRESVIATESVAVRKVKVGLGKRFCAS